MYLTELSSQLVEDTLLVLFESKEFVLMPLKPIPKLRILGAKTKHLGTSNDFAY
jgi:hypothetical protein